MNLQVLVSSFGLSLPGFLLVSIELRLVLLGFFEDMWQVADAAASSTMS